MRCLANGVIPVMLVVVLMVVIVDLAKSQHSDEGG